MSTSLVVVRTGLTGPAGPTGPTGPTGPAGSPGGSDTQVQFNDAGTFGGVTGVTSDGTTITFTADPQWSKSSNVGTLAWTPTATRTLTLPDATDTLVGKATTDVFTNKTFSVDATGNILTSASAAAGDILYHNGTKYVPLAKSTDGKVLTLASGLPSWATPSAGAPGGSDRNLQFDNSGAFGGATNLDYDSGGGLAVKNGKYVKFFFGSAAVQPAQSGYLRLDYDIANEQFIPIMRCRQSGDTRDMCLFTYDSVNQTLYVGLDESFNINTECSTVRMYAAGSLLFGYGGGTLGLSISANGFQPAIPLVGASVPWGSLNATASIATADANVTVASSDYQCAILKFTGANTANRDATLPDATDDKAYEKTIDNTCTGAFYMRIKTSSGTTVDVPNGSVVRVLVDSRGVKRITSNVTPDSGLRLTLTSGTPVTTTTVSGAGTLYLTPDRSATITTYDNSVWTPHVTPEVSLALTMTNGKNYDVFAYWTGTAIALELSTAWTNDTTRADAIARQDGAWVKSGDHSRLYLGTVRANGTDVTADSVSTRFLWNYWNRRQRRMLRNETTASWTWSTNSYQQANGASANKVEYVTGMADTLLNAHVAVSCSTNNNSVPSAAGIGIDSTSTNSAEFYGTAPPTAGTTQLHAEYHDYPGLGYHAINWLEIAGAGTATFYGSGTTNIKSGLFADVHG